MLRSEPSRTPLIRIIGSLPMKAFSIIPLVLGLVSLAQIHASAAITLNANITHAQETATGILTTSTGELRPLSYGTASFLLNDAMTSLSFTATIYNIDVTGTQTADVNDNLRNAHIHAGPSVTFGVNGPVVFGFFGTPFNDNNPNDAIMTPFATGVGGVFASKWDLSEGQNTTLTAQLPNILAGRSYINFHTVQFPGGEIRGQILAVPETGSAMVLLGLGLLSLLGLARRKQIARP